MLIHPLTNDSNLDINFNTSDGTVCLVTLPKNVMLYSGLLELRADLWLMSNSDCFWTMKPTESLIGGLCSRLDRISEEF